ncbi:MAG: hypothetical protein MHMPM18_005219 [Marteilia pararefringens]
MNNFSRILRVEALRTKFISLYFITTILEITLSTSIIFSSNQIEKGITAFRISHIILIIVAIESIDFLASRCHSVRGQMRRENTMIYLWIDEIAGVLSVIQTFLVLFIVVLLSIYGLNLEKYALGCKNSDGKASDCGPEYLRSRILIYNFYYVSVALRTILLIIDILLLNIQISLFSHSIAALQVPRVENRESLNII